MICVAICHDGEDASVARASQFQAHVAHNIANIGTSLLTGVLANADGVMAIESDPRLCGSLYCVNADLPATRQIMEGDSFFTGRAWKQIDYYQWQDPTGAWLDTESRPKGLSAEFRCYLAVSKTSLKVDDALMAGGVVPLASTGASPEPLAAIALVRAGSMEEARAMVPGADWVAALPAAIGRWVGVSSLADIESLRKR